MATPASPLTQNPDPGATYQALYDALGDAYWEAATIQNKDLIHGAMEGVYDIITAFDEQDIANNTSAFIALKPKIDQTNAALAVIEKNVNTITSRIGTASTLLGAIAKVLSLFP
jgi:hypothetical protein